MLWMVFWLLGLSAALAQSVGGGAGILVFPAQAQLAAPGNTASALAFGADNTGRQDSSLPLLQAVASQVNGLPVNIYLPAGNYHLTRQITLPEGRCLYGDGPHRTTITVAQDFDPKAQAVILATNTQRNLAPCIHDLHIQFDQPSDQAVRANFRTLAQGCTSTLGGTGCQYPPAILHPAGTSNGLAIWNLTIGNAWDGINDQHAGGINFHDIGIGALNRGIILDNGHDFGYLAHYEFHNQFGVCGLTQPTVCPLYTGVYQDGATFAVQIGTLDGTTITDFRTWEARVQLTSAFSWASFSDLKLDGVNSTLEVAATDPGAGGLQITNVYATGKPTDGHCQIHIGAAATQVVINNMVLRGAGATSLCVAGGSVVVTGGMIPDTGGQAKIAGGSLTLTGVIGPGGTPLVATSVASIP